MGSVVLLSGRRRRAKGTKVKVLRKLPTGLFAESSFRPGLLLVPFRSQQPRKLPHQSRQPAKKVLFHQSSYLVKDKWRRINSVEYFKKGIQPKWEDPKNEKGGRFVFPVNRNQENKDELYCNLVFFLLG